MRSWVQPLDPCEKTWVRWCILVMLMLVNIWGMVANQPSLLGKFQASVSQNRMEWYLRLPCWLHTQVYTHMHIPHLSIGIFHIFAASTSIWVWLTIVTYTVIIRQKKYIFYLVIKSPGPISELRAPSWLVYPSDLSLSATQELLGHARPPPARP